MNPFPFERFYIESPLTPKVVEEQLKEKIEKPVYRLKNIFSSPSGAYFEGKIAGGVFRVQPVVTGRNSFIPQIKGSITPYRDGSLISVRV